MRYRKSITNNKRRKLYRSYLMILLIFFNEILLNQQSQYGYGKNYTEMNLFKT